MGNAVPRQAAAPSQQAYIEKPEKFLKEEVPPVRVVKQIGHGRFLKTYKCTENDRLMVVKVYVKRDADEDLGRWRVGIDAIAKALSPRRECPNVQPYTKAFVGRRPTTRGVTGAAFCVRQHFWSNLLDRLGTRPFLSLIEKKWLLYQLLRAVEQCHQRGVCHGDLSCENVMVTSWTWVTLVDFASYKPTYVPDDGPEFDYYFCAKGSSGSQSCYVAPERFLLGGSGQARPEREAGGDLDPAMDIFSLGCVIAEIFRSRPTFDLATLMRMLREERDLEASPAASLEPPQFRDVVSAMLSRHPENRGDATQHLNTLQEAGVLPPEFSAFVYEFFTRILLDAQSPDDRIMLVCANYGRAMREMAGVRDDDAATFFHEFCFEDRPPPKTDASSESDEGRREASQNKRFGKQDANAEKADEPTNPEQKNARGRVAVFLSAFCDRQANIVGKLSNVDDFSAKDDDDDDSLIDELMEGCEDDVDALMHISTDELLLRTERLLKAFGDDPEASSNLSRRENVLGNERSERQRAQNKTEKKTSASSTAALAGDEREGNVTPPATSSLARKPDGGSLILLAQLVCVTMRYARWPRTKLVSLALLLRFGIFLDDEARLQRLVPHIMSLFEDASTAVQAAACRALADCVSRVETFAASDAALFPKFILPALTLLSRQKEEAVVVALAETVATFAEAARRFLDIVHDTRAESAATNNTAAENASDPSAESVLPSSSEGNSPPQTPDTQTHGPVLVVSNDSDRSLSSSNESLNETTEDSTAIARQGRNSQQRAAYDEDLVELREVVRSWVVELLGDAPAMAKHALLRDMPRLCVFFGREQTQGVLMPHLTTLLNDSDWSLRDAFCAHVAAVCAFLGRDAAEGLVNPCIDQALVDTEPIVIARALRSLASLVDLGLLSRAAVLDFAYLQPASAAPLLLHPSRSVRVAAAAYLASACRSIGNPADVSALLVEPALLAERRKLLVDPLAAPRCTTSQKKSPLEQLLDLEATKVDTDDDSLSPLTFAILQALREPVDAATYRAALRGAVLDSDNESLKLMSEYLARRRQSAGVPAASHVINPSSTLPFSSQTASRAGKTTEGDFSSTDRLRNAAQEGGCRSVGGIAPRPILNHPLALAVPDQKYVSALKATGRLRGDIFGFVDVDEGEGDSETISYDDDIVLKAHFGVFDGGSNEVRAFGGDPEDVFAATDQSTEDSRTPPSGSKATRRVSSASSLGILASPASASDGIDVGTTQSIGASAPDGRPPKPRSIPSKSATFSEDNDEEDRTDESQMQTVTPQADEERTFAEVADEDDDAAMGPPCQSSMTPMGRRVLGLGVPPLPPELGCLRQPKTDQPFSWYKSPLALDAAETKRRVDWRPKGGVMFATLKEHKAAVCRLAVAQDHSFFASASHDGTAKVWATRNIHTTTSHRSVCTYEAGRAGSTSTESKCALTDACAVDNSRSIAIASSGGFVHVWRVELAPGAESSPPRDDGNACDPLGHDRYSQQGFVSPGISSSTTAAGRRRRMSAASFGSRTALVRELRPSVDEGAVLSVNHYNTDSQCLVIYGTQHNRLHACDLRARREAWTLEMPPELGLLTAVALGTDKNWVCAGTSRGYVALWDTRYQLLAKLWRHSSHSTVHRLATCARLPITSSTEGASAPLAFVAAGDNEVAVWDLSLGGECLQCFRARRTSPHDVVSGDAEDKLALPTLKEVPVQAHPKARVCLNSALNAPLRLDDPKRRMHTVRTIMGRISVHGNSFVITAGTDCHIRYWDFFDPKRCMTVSGPKLSGMRPVYENPRVAVAGTSSATDTRYFVCRDMDASDPPPPADVPLIQQRGPVSPPTAHIDAILDLKSIDYPTKLMLSSKFRCLCTFLLVSPPRFPLSRRITP